MKRKLLRLFFPFLLISIIFASCQSVENTGTGKTQEQNFPIVMAPESHKGTLTLATTTSTQDSGLLHYLLPDFEARYGVKVDVIAVGTGQALKLGEDGNVDVLLVHARLQEDQFMQTGHGIRREDVMYNDFIISGPTADPAGIRGMGDAAGAFRKIASSESVFISRGDNSGTHIKEIDIWAASWLDTAGAWYISAGQGMGEVLGMADEKNAYTLSDRATYLARLQRGLDLDLLVEGDPVLFNPYGVIAVNPEKNPAIKADLADKFIEWIVSLPVQEMIASFGIEEYGQPLFTPDSRAWRSR
jgi:tungstate transport system substrate-binding protein